MRHLRARDTPAPACAQVFGFLNGPHGIFSNIYTEVDEGLVADYRNMGGFDMIGSGWVALRGAAWCRGAAAWGRLVHGRQCGRHQWWWAGLPVPSVAVLRLRACAPSTVYRASHAHASRCTQSTQDPHARAVRQLTQDVPRVRGPRPDVHAPA